MVTKQQIFTQLKEMGAPQDSVVLMHSSLRLIGEVEGGGEGLLDALISYFTEKGGLFCVPTHTWANIGKDVPTLDLTVAESNLGAMARIAAADPRGIRTQNPTHSMVVFGNKERAAAFAAGELDVKTPTAPEGCYGKLYRENGYVLLLGVSQCSNTYLHCVDEILETPDRMGSKPLDVTVRLTDGSLARRQILLYKCSTTKDVSERFGKLELAFRYRGAIRDGWLGNAPVQLCSTVKMLETMQLIYERSEGKDPLGDEKPIKPKLFY
jgi:aminoglycoside 3-N-acetyltransferase